MATKKYVHLLLVIFAMTVVGLPLFGTSHQPEPITEITLERTRCYGPCPIYKVVLRRDGQSIYVGKEHVQRIGTFKTTINKDDFDRLAHFLSSRGFFDLKDKYSDGFRVQDISTDITSAVRSGKRKTVKRKTLSDQGPNAAPAALREIEKAIDETIEQLDWKP